MAAGKAKVLSVIGVKGGVGKSTLAICLARWNQLRGRRTLLMDTDSQGTCYTWSRIQEKAGVDEPTDVVRAIKIPDILDVKERLEEYDRIVIDGVPHDTDLTQAVVNVSDLCLMPVRPSAADMWAARPLVELWRHSKKVRGSAAFVISMQKTGTVMSRIVQEPLEDLGKPKQGNKPVDVLFSRTSDLIGYVEAIGAGLTPEEVDPNSKAAEEIDSLAEEVNMHLLPRKP